MPWKYNGKIIKEGRGWVGNAGTKHPASWGGWPDADKTAAGLVWEDAPANEAPFDNKFYWGRQADGTLIERGLTDVNEVDDDGNAILDSDGNQVVTKGLKTQAVEQVKETARQKLAETDWMIIKSVEDSTFTVPQSVLTYRAAVRTASNTIETSITNAADHTAFRGLHDSTEDDDGNFVAPPIDNWPDEI
jgi:hypothetical protein